MQFTVQPVFLVNFFIIAVGIGVCALCIVQVASSAHLPKVVRQFFTIFFSTLLLYISTHLAREIMDGQPGSGVRTALFIVTFAEILAAGLMAHMMSMLILSVTEPQNAGKIRIALHLLLLLHAAVLIIGCFNGMIYRFDEANVYHRGPLYLLSNLSPLVMLVINLVLLIRRGRKMDPEVRRAFLIYLIAPVIAIAIQSFSYGIQYIILATVCAAVYMFFVILPPSSRICCRTSFRPFPNARSSISMLRWIPPKKSAATFMTSSSWTTRIWAWRSPMSRARAFPRHCS